MRYTRSTPQPRLNWLGVLGTLMLATSVQAAPPPHLEFVQLTNTTNPAVCGNYYPSINALGTRVAFTSFCDLTGQNPDQNAEVFVMNADGGNVRQLTFSTGISSQNVSINPLGTRIAFASNADLVLGENADGNSEIFTIHFDGTHLTQLTHTTGGTPANWGGCAHPSYGPGGQKILFSSERDLIPGGNPGGNHALFLMNDDGTDLVQLPNSAGGWDGSLGGGGRVVFTSGFDLVPGENADGNLELFTMLRDGTDLTQVTHTTGGLGNAAPRFSANGETIAFRSDLDLTGNNPDLSFEVFRMHADGTHLVQVTSSSAGFSAPWDMGPGKMIVIESDQDLVPGSNPDHNFEIFLARLVP
jgi:Tol biopolymer transport system component